MTQTDELTKLARDEFYKDCAEYAVDTYTKMRLQAHHTAENAKAVIVNLWEVLGLPVNKETIAALDALILTPPVDPLEEVMVECAGRIDRHWDETTKAFRVRCIREALAKRGLELRTVADGGGA